MNKQQLLQIKLWFRKYTARYIKDPTISFPVKLKLGHTARVVREIDGLTGMLGFSPENRLIAETIALLHDIGRFEQLETYHTMADKDSVNHAELGLCVLKENSVLDHLGIADADLIRTAISNHNRLAIEDGLDERTRTFSLLIRDADKLDILRAMLDTDYNGIEEELRTVFLGFPEVDECSPNTLEALKNGKMLRLQDLNYRNDFRLALLAWVFDLNFEQSKLIFAQRCYIEAIAQKLPDTTEVREALANVKSQLPVPEHYEPDGWKLKHKLVQVSRQRNHAPVGA